MIALYKRYLALPVALALCVGKISLFPLSLILLPPSPIIFSAPPPGTGLIGDTLATGTGCTWESGETANGEFNHYANTSMEIVRN